MKRHAVNKKTADNQTTECTISFPLTTAQADAKIKKAIIQNKTTIISINQASDSGTGIVRPLELELEIGSMCKHEAGHTLTHVEQPIQIV